MSNAYRSTWRLSGVSLLVLVLYAGHAGAQNTTAVPDSTVLKTVVIQATRTGSRSPVPHTNYTAGDIAPLYQAQDIPFLLTGVPSLVETSDAGAGIGYTGMRIRGSDPTRINVTINGIPLNDAESQGVFWVDLPDLAASAAEIQVQRGIGASTNGAGAFGATVNLDLSQINAEPSAILTNSIGSFRTRKHSLQVGSGLLGNKVAFSGRLSTIRSDGYIDRAAADLRSYHLTGAYIDDKQSVQAHLLSGHEITYQAWNGLPAQFLDMDSLRTYNSAGTERPQGPYPDEVDDYTQRHYLLHYKRLITLGLDLQLNGHYTRGVGFFEQYKAGQDYIDYGLPVPMPGGAPITATDLVRRRWLDNHFYGGTFALRWQPLVNPPALNGPPMVLLGGGYHHYEGQHFGEVVWAEYAVPKDHRYYDNQAAKQDANVYGKIELHLRKGLSTFIDLQYRHVRYSFLGFDQEQNNVTQRARLHFFNPKLGLHWQFRTGWAAYAFWGIGQREPNRDDYTQSTPAGRPRPEKMFDWEAGLKGRGQSWSAVINFFYMDYRDQLVLDGRINDVGAYIRTNIPRSFRRGVELEGDVRWLDRWLLRANLALSQNRIEAFTEYRDNWDTGAQDAFAHRNTDIAFSPAIIGRAEAVFDLIPAGKVHHLALSVSGKYVGKQFLDNTGNESTTLPGYFFTDMRLNYNVFRWTGREINVIFAVNNVFDARYASNGWVYRFTSEGYDERPDNPYTRLEGNGIYHQAGFFPQAGRNMMATLRLDF